MRGTRDSKRMTAVLFLGGTASGVLTVLTAEIAGQGAPLVPSLAFGLMLSVCLAIFQTVSSARQIFFLIGASITANILALLTGGFVQLAMAGSWPMGNPPEDSPVALFVAGLVGALVIMSATLAQVRPGVRFRDFAVELSLCSPVGGILAAVGWTLGPSLGMALWQGSHALGLTAPTETALNAMGQASHALSTYLVWQAGMGLVLGIALQRAIFDRAGEVKQS